MKKFLRVLFSGVILGGSAAGAVTAGGLVLLIHDGDAPWTVRDSVYPWDGFIVGGLVFLIGTIGSVWTFRSPRLGVAAWSLFGVASLMLLFYSAALIWWGLSPDVPQAPNPGGAANRSQPVHAETNQTSVAAGSGR